LEIDEDVGYCCYVGLYGGYGFGRITERLLLFLLLSCVLVIAQNCDSDKPLPATKSSLRAQQVFGFLPLGSMDGGGKEESDN